MYQEDALNMFLGTDLNYMIMEDVLVTKRVVPEMVIQLNRT